MMNLKQVGQFFGSLDGMAAFLDEVIIDESDEFLTGNSHITRFLKKFTTFFIQSL